MHLQTIFCSIFDDPYDDTSYYSFLLLSMDMLFFGWLHVTSQIKWWVGIGYVYFLIKRKGGENSPCCHAVLLFKEACVQGQFSLSTYQLRDNQTEQMRPHLQEIQRHWAIKKHVSACLCLSLFKHNKGWMCRKQHVCNDSLVDPHWSDELVFRLTVSEPSLGIL